MAAITVPATAADPAGGIAGRVTTQNFSTGIAGAAVKVVDPDNWSQVYHYSVSDAQGFYQFVGINTTETPSGLYRVVATVNIGGQTYIGYSSNFSVEANSTASVNVRIYIPDTPTPTPMPSTGGIAGRVTTQNTTRYVANATLKVVDSDDNSSIFYTCVSDEGGYYAFVGINTTGTPSGYYQVIASANIDGQLYEGYSNSFRVEPNSTAQVNVVIFVPEAPTPITGGISGRVTTQNTTQGIANATVEVVDPDNWAHVYHTGVTDANGFFQFVGVNTTGTPSGYYQLYISVKIGDVTYAASSYSFMVEENSTAIANVAIYIPESPTPITGGISGRVTTQNTTQGIANATLKVVDPDDLSSVIYTGVSDPNGFFQFVGVNISGTPSGYYKIIASVDIGGQTYEGYSVSFRVEENSTAAVSIVIEVPENPAPTAPGSISGRVTFNGNIGAPYAVVKVVDASDPSVVYYTGTANSRGYFQFTGVNNTWDPASGQYEDKYKVYATSRNGLLKFAGYSGSFAVESDSTAAVNVQVTRSP